MIALGLYAGIQVALRDAPRRGINRDQLMNVALLAAVLGIIGGRLYYVVQNNPSFYVHHPAEIIAVWQGGMAFFGAVVGGRWQCHPGAGTCRSGACSTLARSG